METEIIAKEENDRLLGLCVKKLSEQLLKPACHTPSEVLYLSNLDDQPANWCTCQTIHVYSSSNNPSSSSSSPCEEQDPVNVIKATLPKALVHYYPLTGRLAKSQHSPGKLQVVCEQQGALFVEAAANCSLEQVDYFSRLTPALKQLVPQYPSSVPHHHVPPLVVQVTRFKCGGWVLGMALSHVMVDGLGFGQFLHAMAELATDPHATKLSVDPLWMRHLLKPESQARPDLEHPEFAVADKTNPKPSQALPTMSAPNSLIQQSFEIGAKCVERLKDMVMKQAKGKLERSRCSTFEVMAAFAWKARLQALLEAGFLSLADDNYRQNAPLRFAVNMRAAGLVPAAGYYGNAFHCAYVAASVAEVCDRHVAELVLMVQAAKRRLTSEYVMSAVDFIEMHRDRLLPPSPTHLYLTDWTRMPYQSADFGWGPAVHVSTAEIPFMYVVAFLPCPSLPKTGGVDCHVEFNGRGNGGDGDGDRVVMKVVACLPPKAMRAFATRIAHLEKQRL